MKCFNHKVIGGLALAALAVFLIAPGAFSAVLPLLFVAACPLSMVLMMRGMSGGQCSTRGSEAEQERPAGTTGPSPTAEAEIVRLRAEIDQLREADKAARSNAASVTVPRAGEGRREGAGSGSGVRRAPADEFGGRSFHSESGPSLKASP